MATVTRTPASSTILRVALVPCVFALGAYWQSTGLLPAIFSHGDDVLYLVNQHIRLVAVSSAMAIVVAVPLGIVLTRRRFLPYTNFVTQFINLGTTIPTLAVLALSMSFLGIGALPAIVGLFVLSLLPILLNTVAGIRSVPAHLIEAARGMGLTRRQILFQAELPNAAFVILAGIRTALAINVGSAPVAFLIGGGGLGELIFTGIDLMDSSMLLAGAIPTALLAIFIDSLVGQLQYWLIPRGVNPLR